jgi:hypothetical protein
MGIDFLDMNFRIEKRFGVFPSMEAWKEVIARSGRKRDLTAGEVCNVVEQFLRQQGRLRTDVDQNDPGLPHGPFMLQYEPRHLPGSGDRRKKYDWRENDVWPAVQTVISETLHIPIEQIARDSLLVRDLGMS